MTRGETFLEIRQVTAVISLTGNKNCFSFGKTLRAEEVIKICL